jgi:hypothetical protein
MTQVVVIAPAPTSILVNPDVIEPAFNAPVVVRPVIVVIEFCVAVAPVPV